MSNIPPQKWCGQSQPHTSHIWVEQGASLIGLYMECAGYREGACPSCGKVVSR